MRVLQIITTLSVGGAETMLRNIALGLPNEKYQQHVVSLTDLDTIGAELIAAGVPVTALGGRGGTLWPAQISRARALVKSWQPDIIHTWMYHANLVGRLLLSLDSPRARPRFIASVRGALNSPSTQKRILRVVRWLDARSSRAADSIIFNSQVSANQHQAIGYDATKSVVIPNGFDIARFTPDSDVRQGVRAQMGLQGVVIGMVARFDPLKGHALLLRAAAIARASGRRCQIVIAGRHCDNNNSLLTTLISELGLAESVLLLGERLDIPELMNAFDIVVCPSLSESFPNAIGEAMSSAVPCLVTNVGDCGYLVGDTGAIVPPADADAMASELIKLIDMDEATRLSLGTRARQRISDRFSIESVLRQYSEVYGVVTRSGAEMVNV